MGERLVRVDYGEIEGDVKGHLAGLPSAIDSFFEEHILDSSHYLIVDGDAVAGFASIHDRSLITLFAVREQHRTYGQRYFWMLRRSEQVRSAFVPTCDEYYLSHALDDGRSVAKQAYFFAARSTPRPTLTGTGWSLREATQRDLEVVRAEAGDFFEPVVERIDRGGLFVTERDGEVVGFGVIEQSRLYAAVASIGMFTVDRHRRTGVGTATIVLLRDECALRRLRPVAGCWYYNHASKRTLERAGFYAPTRLLRLEY